MWATSPRNYPKVVRYYFYPQGSNVRIVAITSYPEKYTVGSILFVFFVIIFIIIANSYVTSLPKINQEIVKTLLVLIYILIAVSAIIGVYNYVKRDSFAEEVLRILA